MANSQKAAFYEKYAAMAMDQQQKYGIPASVTLAQMYIESAGGTSRLAVNGNNYFGIKCSRDWLSAGKPYSLHNDDKPNEKFCNYGSVEESVQHHSQFLMGKRYADCRKCASDDYQGWAYGLKAAGYATNPSYATALIFEIEAYGLQRYDQMAIHDAQQRDLTIGYAKGHHAPFGKSPTSSPVVTAPTPSDVLLAQQGGVLNNQQRQNAEDGATLANATGSDDPKNMLAYLMGMNGDQQYSHGGDLFTSLISGLFMAAIGMAMQLDRAGNDDSQSVAATDSRQEETEEQKAATLIKRQRESVDPDKAHELAMMNFDAEYPEQKQGSGQRLA